VINFIEKARVGESLPNQSVLKIASLFKDELTLANIPRPQLVSMLVKILSSFSIV
jgi:hypothetical protein